MKNKSKRIISSVALIIMPFIVALICLCIGRIGISPIDVIKTVFYKLNNSQSIDKVFETTIVNIRLPRIILALFVGMGLSVSGLSFQSLFSNPLATPDTLGVAGGASFGTALGILLGLNTVFIQLMGFIMGLVAVFLTYISAYKKGRSAISTMVLSGIMIGSLFSALVSFVKFAADSESQLPAITFWLMGSMNNVGFDTLKIGVPIIFICVFVLFLLRWKMNILPLSDEEAVSTGTNVKALRIVTVLCATLITSSCVSLCGQVGWIGLLIPHLCRMKFGSNHKELVPSCISFGSCFTVIVDTVARSVSSAEIPISILTAIIGAPFFIIFMRKSKGWQI